MPEVKKYKEQLPKKEHGTEATLKDYYYLTLILGFGLLFSIGIFVSVVQVKYSGLKKEFEVEAALALSGLDLVFSNQHYRIENLEAELGNSPSSSRVLDERLNERLNRTDFNRLALVKLDPATQAIQRTWEFVNRPETLASDFDYQTMQKIRESLLRLSSSAEKSTGLFFRGSTGTEFAILRKYLDSNNTFLIAFLDADRLMRREAEPGQYILVEQTMFGDSEFFLLAEAEGGNRILKVLTPEEIRDIRTQSSFHIIRSVPSVSDAVRIHILKHHNFVSDIGWPISTILACLTITGLVAFLVFSLINRNIEVHKQVEQKTQDLEAESRKARDAADAKTRFLANVSHEVRTPLNLILGMADLLRETPLSEEQSRFVDNFSRAGNHLLRLIGDILDVAKLDSDGIKIFPDRVQLLKFFEELIEFVAPSCLMKNLSVNLYIDPHLPKEASFDPGRVRQIVLNLLNNSLKFTDTGSISIEVKHLVKEPSGRSGICLTVTDTGIGIPADQVEDIFKEFYQVDASATRSRGGAGLGLSIVRAIVDKLGGEIQVHSEVNMGTSIAVFLPLEFLSPHRIEDLINWNGKKPDRVALLYADEKLCVETFRFLSDLGILVDSMPLTLSNLKQAKDRFNESDYVFIELSPETQLNWYRVLKDNIPEEAHLVVITKGHLEVDLARSFSESWDYSVLQVPVLPTQIVAVMEGSMRNVSKPALARTPAAAPALVVPESFKVLIVEDDYDNRVLIEAYMAKLSFRYEFAVNGKEALAAVAADRPSLIVTDLQMPVMDGFTFIEHVRRIDAAAGRPPCPIVVLTADAQEETVRAAKKLLVEKILTKPVRKKDFIEVLTEFGQQYSQAQAPTRTVPPNDVYSI